MERLLLFPALTDISNLLHLSCQLRQKAVALRNGPGTAIGLQAHKCAHFGRVTWVIFLLRWPYDPFMH
jgi:hypothetical protein